MFKEGYIELNEFIKKHYGIEDKYTLYNKRAAIVKLIKRNNKTDLLLPVNSSTVVIESKLYEFLMEKQDYLDKKGGKLKWRLK